MAPEQFDRDDDCNPEDNYKLTKSGDLLTLSIKCLPFKLLEDRKSRHK